MTLTCEITDADSAASIISCFAACLSRPIHRLPDAPYGRSWLVPFTCLTPVFNKIRSPSAVWMLKVCTGAMASPKIVNTLSEGFCPSQLHSKTHLAGLQIVSEMLETISEEMSDPTGEAESSLTKADSFAEDQSSPEASPEPPSNHERCIQVSFTHMTLPA